MEEEIAIHPKSPETSDSPVLSLQGEAGSSTHLGNSQLLSFLRTFLRVRAGVVLTEGHQGVHPRLVDGLEGQLCVEQVAHCSQRGAHVGGQRRVGQQVCDESMGFSHHSDIHGDTGARRLEKREIKHGRQQK